MTQTFAARGAPKNIETGNVFQPKFDDDGLMPAIVTDAGTGSVLMFAHMNSNALLLTLETGFAHFWSRSRKKLWKKGDDSGNTLSVREIRTDCDQDVLWLSVAVAGDGVACHTGAISCFYRILEPQPGGGVVQLVNSALRPNDSKR